MRRALVTIGIISLIFAAGVSVAAEQQSKPAAAAPQAAAQANADKAVGTTGGCMPDGSCCGQGACAQAAAAAADKAATAETGGGCPCMKNKKQQQ
jgi:hypothetical protein